MLMKATILIFVTFIISLQSTGYDLYAHSLFYYFADEKITHSYGIFDDQVIIPRYGVLSIAYELTRSLGIPTGWIAVLFCYKPLMAIILNQHWLYGFRQKRSLILVLCTIPIYFYSGLSLSVLWIFASIVTGSGFFMIGAAFHPVGAIIGTIGVCVGANRKSRIIWLLSTYIILLAVCYINTNIYNFLPSIDRTNLKLSITLPEAVDLIQMSYELKSNEIHAIIVILAVSLMFGTVMASLIKYVSASFRLAGQYLWLPSLLFILTFNSFSRHHHSLITSVSTNHMTKSVYLTWFDFGKKTYNNGFGATNDNRFITR